MPWKMRRRTIGITAVSMCCGAFEGLVGVQGSTTTAAATTTSSPKASSPSLSSLSSTIHRLDLSHQPQLSASTLIRVLTDESAKFCSATEEESNAWYVDLSACHLGNESMDRVVDALVQAQQTKSVALSLRVRQNELTPLGASTLIRKLMGDAPNSNKKKKTSPVSSKDAEEKDANQREETSEEEPRATAISLVSLDLAWNYLSSDLPGSTALHSALQRLVVKGTTPSSSTESSQQLQRLALDCCSLGPGACRALAQGLAQRWGADTDSLSSSSSTRTTREEDDDDKANPQKVTKRITPVVQTLSLSLRSNPLVSNAGTAALAAGLRMAAAAATSSSSARDHDDSDASSASPACIILDELNLSACHVGDAGVEALALALEDAPPSCRHIVRHLDLGHNKVGSSGTATLGRALMTSTGRRTPAVSHLDLSHNLGLGKDARGVSALAKAMEMGCISSLTLRSCNIYADGASVVGRALKKLAAERTFPIACEDGEEVDQLWIDLSGNPLGLLRGKTRGANDKKDGGMYSASRLKSKASATAASYMNLFKRSLKDVPGVDVFLSSQGEEEEDDEDEDEINQNGSSEDNVDSSVKLCGARALAEAFLAHDGLDSSPEKNGGNSGRRRVFHVALRRCFFDHDAADALAAIKVEALDRYGVEVDFDLRLNPILEDDMVEALQGNPERESLLRDMAERHVDVLEALRESDRRAAEARASASALAKVREASAARKHDPAFWDAPTTMDVEDDFDNEDEYDRDYEHDSDADYEEEGEDEEY